MSFSPETFMQMTFEEANETTSIPIPEGEYQAMSTGSEVTQWTSRDGSKSGLKLTVTWEIADEKAKEATGKDKLTVRQDIMLDLTDTGSLAFGKGKNVTLGRLREALKLNQPGQPFNFAMLAGRMALVLVKHRPFEDRIFEEVKGVAAI